MKKCTKCGTSKHVSEFGPKKEGKGGLQAQCKDCVRLRTALYQVENKSRVSSQRKGYRLANISSITEAKHQYFKDNQQKIAAHQREYFLDNREKVSLQRRGYAVANKEAIAERQRIYRIENSEELTEKKRNRYLRNVESVAAKGREYRANNPEKMRIHHANRRARKLAAGGKLSKSIVLTLFASQRGVCACCDAPLGNKYHVDHIMPLALGGSNTDDNVQLLSPSCNQRKGAKHPAVYAQECKNRIINALV